MNILGKNKNTKINETGRFKEAKEKSTIKIIIKVKKKSKVKNIIRIKTKCLIM